MKKISVLLDNSYQNLYYKAYPLLCYKGNKIKFQFTNSLKNLKLKHKNDELIIFKSKTFLSNTPKHMFDLRLKFQKIYLYDNTDSSKITYPNLIDEIDVYLKNNIFIDKNKYLLRDPTIRIYEEYFLNEKSKFRLSESQINKIKPAWDLELGLYPINKPLMKLGKTLSWFLGPKVSIRLVKTFNRLLKSVNFNAEPKKEKRIHAIFSDHPNAVINRQRAIIREKYNSDLRFYTEKVNQRKYYKLMRRSLAVISPFGYGEMCYRDYEAILNECLLIKPSISHLNNSQTLFVPMVTYIPINWEINDLELKINDIFNRHMEYKGIIYEAKKRLLKRRMNSDQIVEEILL